MEILLGIFDRVRGVLFRLPSLIWQRTMKRRLNELAARLEAFREERAQSKPRSTTGEADAAYHAAGLEWQQETRRLFYEAYLPDLQALQDDLADREISDSKLWGERDLHAPVRLDRIISKLQKLARRRQLLR